MMWTVQTYIPRSVTKQACAGRLYSGEKIVVLGQSHSLGIGCLYPMAQETVTTGDFQAAGDDQNFLN